MWKEETQQQKKQVSAFLKASKGKNVCSRYHTVHQAGCWILFSLLSFLQKIKGNFSFPHPESTDAGGYWHITVHHSNS